MGVKRPLEQVNEGALDASEVSAVLLLLVAGGRHVLQSPERRVTRNAMFHA